MSKERCGTCRYWGLSSYYDAVAAESGDSGPHCDGSAGSCRRRSPIAVKQERYPGATALWPVTARGDLCGDYQSRPTPATQHDFTIEIQRLSEEDGGGFLATVPELPGCMSDGETRAEALVNVEDAIQCWKAVEGARR